MSSRRRPIQDAMEDDRISRLQQVIENLADSVAAMQIQMQQQQQARQQQQQRPDPCFVEDEEIFPEKIIENNNILDSLEGGSNDWNSPPIFDVDDVCMSDCLFTSTLIPDPVVDWSTSPSFDEDSPIFDEESCFDEKQSFVEETLKEVCHNFANPMDSIMTDQGIEMHPDFFECLHADYHVEDPFYFVRFEFPTSCFIKKIIMDYFILTQWADWMDIVTIAGKFKVRLQNLNLRTSLFNSGLSSEEEEEGLNSRSNSFQPGENDAERRAEEFLNTRRCRRRGIVAGSSRDVAGKDREPAEIRD